MAIPFNCDTNVESLLRINPTMRDKALAGVIEANIPGLSGYIEVSTIQYQFASGNILARKISIYGSNSIDKHIRSIARLMLGSQFTPVNEDRITRYVLGKLTYGTEEYNLAQEETNTALAEKRNITIIIANDASRIKVIFEQNQSGCSIL